MADRATGLRSTLAVGGVVGLGIAALCSLAAGAKSIPAGTVLRSLLDFDGSADQRIVRNLRLPRTCVAATAGAALGAAGALTQAITRNPLADPGLLGVSAGASLAVVVSIVVVGVTSLAVSVWFALAGAGAASLLVFAVAAGGRAGGRSGVRPLRLVLTGLAVSAFVASCTSAIVLQDRATLDQFRFWAVGSVSGRDWSVLRSVAPFILVGLLVAVVVARPLNAVALGDDSARALGANVAATNIAAGVAVALLAGAATAACGPIAFVGLTAAHAARLMWGADLRWSLPGAALLGAVLLSACDAAGRELDRPTEIQAGIMTALIGGPVFVLLVRRLRTVES